MTYVAGMKATLTLWEGESLDTRDDWEEKEKIVPSHYNAKVRCGLWRGYRVLWLICVPCFSFLCESFSLIRFTGGNACING